MNLPIAIDNVRNIGTTAAPQIVGDVLLAGQKAGTTAIDLSTQDAPAAGECQVLNLHLAPINLNLLGLHVDTSEICLDITGDPNGGLLGNLVCGLGNNLNLGGILGQLSGQIDTLLGQLDNLLDDALGQALTVDQVFGNHGDSVCTGECQILDLSLGPVDLNLLGLGVSLDNCHGGPVEVCVSATAGEGLLGDLLCGLADNPLGGGGLGGLIGRIDNLIDQLGDLAGRLEQVANLPNVGKLTKQIDKVIDKLEKVIDRIDNLQNLDQLIKRVEHTVDQLDRLLDRIGSPVA